MKNILIFTLIYPLLFFLPFYDLKYEPYYIFFLNIVCTIEIFIIVINRPLVKFKKVDGYVVLILLILLFLAFLNWNGVNNSKPLIWFLLCFQIQILQIISPSDNLTAIGIEKVVLWFVLIINYLMLFSPNYYLNGRFTGFAISPTVLSVVFEGYVILALLYFQTKIKYLYLILTAFLIWKTETRINFLFLLLIPIIFYLFSKPSNKKYKPIVVLLLIVFTIFIYPLYGLILQSDFASFLNFGERVSDDGTDSSFNLRFHLFIVAIEYLSSLDYYNILFGTGSETLRRVIEIDQGYDLLPHNDYLRLLSDFGLIFAVLYIAFFYKISKKNVFTFLLFILYLFTFYHNMIYSFFIPTLLILFSKFAYGRNKNSKLEGQSH